MPTIEYQPFLADDGYHVAGQYPLWDQQQLYHHGVEPSLLPPADGLPYMPIGEHDQWHTQFDMAYQPADPHVPMAHFEDALDPQLQMLRGNENGWEVQELDVEHGSNWM
jgi:hypothetical protein